MTRTLSRLFVLLLHFAVVAQEAQPPAVSPALDRIALPYYKLESFNTLPTPFRCVATDM
jgi:hypothetical protein